MFRVDAIAISNGCQRTRVTSDTALFKNRDILWIVFCLIISVEQTIDNLDRLTTKESRVCFRVWILIKPYSTSLSPDRLVQVR